jgi:hypothetical protein
MNSAHIYGVWRIMEFEISNQIEAQCKKRVEAAREDGEIN